jgi:hypothetical protein
MGTDKRGGNHLIMSNVQCAHAKCGEVNGRGTGSYVRRLIKQSVVNRMGTDVPLFCYPCQKYMGRTKAMAAGG